MPLLASQLFTYPCAEKGWVIFVTLIKVFKNVDSAARQSLYQPRRIANYAMTPLAIT